MLSRVGRYREADRAMEVSRREAEIRENPEEHGYVLLVSSLVLARETKALLIGEAAQAHIKDAILRIAGEDPDIRRANGVLAVQLGPNQVVAALSVQPLPSDVVAHDRLGHEEEPTPVVAPEAHPTD